MARRSGPDRAIEEEDHALSGPGNVELPATGESLADASYVDPQVERDLDEGIAGDFAEIGPTAHEEQLRREQINRETADVLATMRDLEGADEIRWRISRTGDTDPKRNGFLATWTGSQISQDRIRDAFGGGKYKFIGYYTNGRYAAHKIVIIADDAPRSNQQGARMNAENAGFNLSEFLAQQDSRDQKRRQEELDRRRYDEERDEKRSRDRLTLIAAVATPVATVLAAVLGNKGPDIGSLIAATKGPDPLQLLAGLKTLMPEAPPVTPQPDAIDKAISIMEKIEAFKGNPNGETGWLDVVKEIARSAGPAIGPLIGAAVTRAQALAAQRAAHGAPGVIVDQAEPQALPAPQDAGAQPPPEGTDVNLLKAAALIPWLKGKVEQFLPSAQKHRNPEIYAAMLLEELPEDQDPETLKTFIERPDWFDGLKSLDPRVANHAQWFAQLRAHLLDYMKEDEEVQPASPTPPPQRPATAVAAVARPAPVPSEVPTPRDPSEPVSLSQGGV